MNVGGLRSLCVSLPPLFVAQRQLNANRTATTKIRRLRFTRQYPTTVVLPDGSTISVKHPEPRLLLRLPLDLEQATEEQKRKIQLLRRPKLTQKVTEDTDDTYDPMKYLKF